MTGNLTEEELLEQAVAKIALLESDKNILREENSRLVALLQRLEQQMSGSQIAASFR